MQQHCVIIHAYIYNIGAFKFRFVDRLQANWPMQLAVMGDNTGTSCVVILVLSPSKYNSQIVLSSN